MAFLKSVFSSKPSVSFPEEWLDHDVSQLDFVVIDCEMTGLNPRKDKILSVAAVKISKGKILTDSPFYKVIKQESTKLKTETILIHRLNHELIDEGDSEASVIAELYDFCQGSIPIGHFFEIDLSFLPKNHDFSFPHLDTRNLAYNYLLMTEPQLDPRQELQLQKLAQRFELPKFNAHHALSDVCSTACLFLKFIHLYRSHNIITLNSFLEKA